MANENGLNNCIMKNILVILLTIVCSGVSSLSAQAPGGKSDSYCTFAGKKGGNITKKEIESANTLVFVGPDSTWKVTHFRLSVVSKSLPYKEFGVDGEMLSDEMINYLQRCPASGKFYIEYIRVGNKNSSRQIVPLSFVVIE